MNIASTLLLAFAMSTDAFAAAVGKGATLHRPRIREALRTGLIFGVIEAITPLVGWALGKAAAPYVASWDHWIAFSLLFVLGARAWSARALTCGTAGSLCGGFPRSWTPSAAIVRTSSPSKLHRRARPAHDARPTHQELP